MYWEYMTLADDTEVTFSETKSDGTVGVWIETPIDGGFKSAHCTLPNLEWDSIRGYDNEELKWFEDYLRNNEVLILEMSWEKTDFSV